MCDCNMSKQGVGRYFCFIKNRVSSDWKDLAWCLGFETPDIDDIDTKHRNDKSRCMDLLQQWHKRKGNAATIHVMMEALQDAELQHVVDSLKDKYPGEFDFVQLNKRKALHDDAPERPRKHFQTNPAPLQPTAREQAGNTDATREEVKMLKERNEKLEKIIQEQKEKIQQLQETNQKVEAGIDTPLTGVNVRPIRVGQPWVRKVRFGRMGSGKREFNHPVGVAVSQDNEVYIADLGNSRIQVFTMDGLYIREFTTTLPGETGKELEPHDVAVDRNDNLWVVSNYHVVQYSRQGTCLARIDLPHVEYIHGITVAMAIEQVIVTEYDGKNGRLRVFKQGGSDMGTAMSTYGSSHRSPKPWWPVDVTVDGEGNILVADHKNHCVHVLDRDGSFKFKFGREGSDESLLYPEGICVDGMGNIIVTDTGNGCVKMFDSQGRFLCHIGSGMKSPCGVAVSPGGDVVVTDIDKKNVSVWTHG